MEHGPLRPPTLLAMPSYLAAHVGRIGRRPLAAALADLRLRLPHYAVLVALLDFGPLAQHELADRVGFNRSHLVGYLDLVEKRGLVERQRDPHDRRRQRVAITSPGRSVVSALAGVAEEGEADTLRALSAAERRTLTELLLRIVTAADESRAAAAGPDPRPRLPGR